MRSYLRLFAFLMAIICRRQLWQRQIVKIILRKPSEPDK